MDKIKEILFIIYFINIFILFIYLTVWRLTQESDKLSISPLTKINIFFSIIHRNKKESLGEVLTRLDCESKKGSCRLKRFFLFFILLIYLAVQRLIGELGKLLIYPLAKTNIFFSMINRNKKERLNKILTMLGSGCKKGFCRQN